jgi:23S rRNA (guanosine2251-2'-O)-methyltransferase
MQFLAGIHAVREALRAGHSIDRVHVHLAERGGGRLGEIVELCRKAGVPVRRESREQLDRLVPGTVHQGVVAVVASHKYADLNELLDRLDHPGLLVVLDGIEDPHNLGAIVRSAHAAGADALVLPERRAAGLTAAAAKAAAGALEYLPVARVTNLNRTLEDLKRRRFWITGLDERGGKDFWALDFTGPTVLVFGAEGHGLHEQVREKCDFLARIPMTGRIPSLNVSVAAGLVLFEALRQRTARKGTQT